MVQRFKNKSCFLFLGGKTAQKLLFIQYESFPLFHSAVAVMNDIPEILPYTPLPPTFNLYMGLGKRKLIKLNALKKLGS